MTLTMPLAAFRFRLVSNYPLIDEHVESITFDFANSAMQITVRQTATADGFSQALGFAKNKLFDVTALGANGEVVFGIKPLGLKLAEHDFALAYKLAEAARHIFTFTYDDLITGEPTDDDDAPVTPVDSEYPAVGTLDLEEFVELPVELDAQQEMRITPDNPDTDGDGVPDRMDRHPLDPTKQ